MCGRSDGPRVPLHPAPLGPAAAGWFTGRGAGDGIPGDAPGHPSNLSHRRPHRPGDLALARAAVGQATGTDPGAWHLMHQVHGAEVGIVDDTTPLGAEVRGVDALVTTVPDRVLGVSVADCVPVLLAADGAVAAVHAGRAGVLADVVGATLDVLARLGAEPSAVQAVIGPAIGGCCYEVPAALQDQVVADAPHAAATTTWGTPSLDLPTAVGDQLRDRGVDEITRVGACTRCDPSADWFSHRTDPTTGRQVGLIVLRPSGGGVLGTEGGR